MGHVLRHIHIQIRDFPPSELDVRGVGGPVNKLESWLVSSMGYRRL